MENVPLDEKSLLTVSEMASLLQMKKSWVYAHADELGAIRMGKYLRFSKRLTMGRLNKECLTSMVKEAEESSKEGSKV